MIDPETQQEESNETPDDTDETSVPTGECFTCPSCGRIRLPGHTC